MAGGRKRFAGNTTDSAGDGIDVFLQATAETWEILEYRE
jgi:hypothetical protein